MKKPIAFYPELSLELGSIPAAIYYQQLYFWSDKGGREDGFIYKTKEEIEEETTIKLKTQDRIREKLEKKGWLETKLIQVKGAPTLHYRCLVLINTTFTKGKFRIGQNDRMESDKMTESESDKMTESSIQRIPENTTRRVKKKSSSTNKPKELAESIQGVALASGYVPDYKSPLDTLKVRRMAERAIGAKRTNKFGSFIFGTGWDFLKVYKQTQNMEYVGNVMLDEIIKNLATYYEGGETRETLFYMLEDYFASEKAKRITISPKAAFSTDTYNAWKQGKLSSKELSATEQIRLKIKQNEKRTNRQS